MTDLDDGTLLAYLDGEAGAEESTRVRRHLEECARCAGRLREMESERGAASRALGLLDGQAPAAPVDRAREEVLDRVEVLRSRPTGRGTGTWSGARRRTLARAAILLLVAAGVAADQLPGSPLRGWFGQALVHVRSALVEPTEEGGAEVGAGEATPSESGVRLEVTGGAVRILLSGVLPGGRIDVHLVDGSEAGLRGTGGGRYRTAPGLLEAVAPGGPVRVEIPRGVPSATVEVDGRIYLRKVDGRLEITGPATDSTEAEVRFRTPGGQQSSEIR